MSRVGIKPVALASGVTATVGKGTISIKGPKGELTQSIDQRFEVSVEDNQVVVTRPSDHREHKALHGLYRQLIANMAAGVAEGFKKVLEIEGVGYSAKAEGKDKISLSVGYNAPVVMQAPAGVEVATPKPTLVEISGCDKAAVGQFAANIRKQRPPEPYKGKGIRYAGETIRRKAGKAIGGKK